MKKFAFLLLLLYITLTSLPCFSASISGRVIDENGTPVEGILVQGYTNQCSSNSSWSTYTDNEGNYIVSDIPTNSTFFVKACPSCNHQGYIDQWFDGEKGQTNCHFAEPIIITNDQNISNVNFVLLNAPRRLQYFQLVARDDRLEADFAVLPGFENLLESAAITGPGTFKYVFDFEHDRLEWTTECKYLKGYANYIAEDFKYGGYTLTLTFSDGVQRKYSKTLKKATSSLPLVDEDSMSCTVNPDGSMDFWWTPPDPGYYYQFRIRNADGSVEYYRSPTMDGSVGHLKVSANYLRCLEKGKKYYWFVRTYDDNYYFSNWVNTFNAFVQTEYKEFIYNPTELKNRIKWASIWDLNDNRVLAEFSVRYGSKKTITSATLSNQEDSDTYHYDIKNDLFDYSTSTRSNYGWTHLITDNIAEGDYDFTVTFKDDYSETITKHFQRINVVEVDSNTMKTEILEDGAIYFSWDLPGGAPDQSYLIKIRNIEETKEFYKSSSCLNCEGVVVSSWSLRALEPGKPYLWFVRSLPGSSDSAMKNSKKIYFFYNPFGIKTTFDPEGDKDVDGEDLINYVEKGDFSDLKAFAASFGLSS